MVDALSSGHTLESVLEIGCGPGGLVDVLLGMNATHVTAVDRSVPLLREAKKRIKDHRANFVVGDVLAKEFQSGSFDVVVSSLTFHFIEDIERLFANIETWLRNDGVLLFSVRHSIRSSNTGGEMGDREEWLVADYFVGGRRVWKWLGEEFIIFHRTIEDYSRAISGAGLRIDAIIEPRGKSVESSPPFLLFVCKKRRG
jgi:SAM-dependent methyltransferase